MLFILISISWSSTFKNNLNFNITHTIVNNIVLNIDRDNINNRFLLECVTIFYIIIGFSTLDFQDIKHSPMLDGLHNFPRFTQFGILKVKNLSRLTRKYKMVIFIPPTYNINAYAVCISSYHFPSTIGTNIVLFTLEQNNFMAKHILQFPNFAHMTIEVMHFSLMVPFSTYITVLGYTTIV